MVATLLVAPSVGSATGLRSKFLKFFFFFFFFCGKFLGFYTFDGFKFLRFQYF